MCELPNAAIVSNRCWSVMMNKMSGRLICHSERSEAQSRNPVKLLSGFATGCLDFARHDEIVYTSANSPPVRRRNASTYFAELFSITSFGKGGAGGVLFQSRVSR